MTALAVLVGFTLALTLAMAGALAYAIWRFVWVPWKVVRADIGALNRKHDEFAAEVRGQLERGRARVGRFSDPELADIEKHLDADARARRMEQGVVR